MFDSLQGVIKFYTDSLLDTTTLKKIVVIEKVRGKYDFPGRVSYVLLSCWITEIILLVYAFEYLYLTCFI